MSHSQSKWLREENEEEEGEEEEEEEEEVAHSLEEVTLRSRRAPHKSCVELLKFVAEFPVFVCASFVLSRNQSNARQPKNHFA